MILPIRKHCFLIVTYFPPSSHTLPKKLQLLPKIMGTYGFKRKMFLKIPFLSPPKGIACDTHSSFFFTKFSTFITFFDVLRIVAGQWDGNFHKISECRRLKNFVLGGRIQKQSVWRYHVSVDNFFIDGIDSGFFLQSLTKKNYFFLAWNQIVVKTKK